MCFDQKMVKYIKSRISDKNLQVLALKICDSKTDLA